MTNDDKAEMISTILESLSLKYGCEIGVWLSWRDLYKNLEILKDNPQINELQFGLQIRFPNAENAANTDDESGS